MRVQYRVLGFLRCLIGQGMVAAPEAVGCHVISQNILPRNAKRGQNQRRAKPGAVLARRAMKQQRAALIFKDEINKLAINRQLLGRVIQIGHAK